MGQQALFEREEQVTKLELNLLLQPMLDARRKYLDLPKTHRKKREVKDRLKAVLKLSWDEICQQNTDLDLLAHIRETFRPLLDGEFENWECEDILSNRFVSLGMSKSLKSPDVTEMETESIPQQIGWVKQDASPCKAVNIIDDCLTEFEQTELAECEGVISLSLEYFLEVGQALATIRDKKLHRATHKTFEDYCQEKWGIGRQYANRMIGASKVVENLVPIGTKNDIPLPATESQARPLKAIPSEQQTEVWQIVVETAPHGRVTASHVQAVVDQKLGKTKERPYIPKKGEWQALQEEEARQSKEAARWENIPPEQEEPLSDPEDNSQKNAALFSSDSPEWYTPKHIIERVLKVLPEITLDPCSNSKTEPNVPAVRHYTKKEDGLSPTRSWNGWTYLNPPYGSEIGKWTGRLIQEYDKKRTVAAIALVPARTDTAWFQQLLEKYPVCFITGRLKFSGPNDTDNSAPFPSAVFYLGDNFKAFSRAFGDLGIICYSENQGFRRDI